jgi:transcriptional regulator with XRE-family HTH domain
MSQSFAEVFKGARRAAGISQRDLAARMPADQSCISRWESGKSVPEDPRTVQRIDDLLRAGGALRSCHAARTHLGTHPSDDFDALDLARRVTASDVGATTLNHLEAAFDGLATEYPVAAPVELLPRVSRHVGYVRALLDARATLAERQRLHVVGGWLSLLLATVHIDLNQQRPASAWLRTASDLGEHAGHAEIVAWCWETSAWRALVHDQPGKAWELSLKAQHHAPPGSSAAIQAVAQECRSAARLGDADATYGSLEQLHTVLSRWEEPESPEHHYRYDPGKADSHVATTLAWIGDPEAERHAREAITSFTPADRTGPRPRRYASAQLDLALLAAKRGDLDEACTCARTAIATGRLAPSNDWRIREVLDTVTARGCSAADALQEEYRAMLQG